MYRSTLLAAAALVAFSGTAYAHPKLVSASPAANATVATPEHVELHFSEKLMPAFSAADLVMAAMPGMGAMKMSSTAKLGPDGETLIITPATRLPAGHYLINWHVVSTDTHKVAGSYAFAVK